MRKTLVILAAFLVSLPTVYFGCVTAVAAAQGYSWRQMDWNGDGRTTPAEFVASSDIGSRAICKDGKNCTEFYALKDGMPVRIVCD